MPGTEPVYDRDGSRVFHGDALDVLPSFDADSLDAVITDPPYHLTTAKPGGSGLASANPNSPAGRSRIGTGFNKTAWDAGDVAHRPQLWAAVLRVLKPGAHVLAFGGTRTFHRLAVAIEDAGFELRDTLGWIYGSGFPKSLNVSKAIDEQAGVERPVVGKIRKSVTGMYSGLGGAFGDDGFTRKPAVPATAPATDEAKAWDGWGTALKPAWEPIILARKPFPGPVVANVLTHGTGALNIGASQVEGAQGNGHRSHDDATSTPGYGGGFTLGGSTSDGGRWPANLIHDGSDEAMAVFPITKSASKSGGWTSRTGNGLEFGMGTAPRTGDDDSGSAARFFYCAKASQAERWFFCRECQAAFDRDVRMEHRHGLNGWDHLVTHPTQKPLALMRYLIGLIVPPGGTILDPFVGSGTTLIAAGAAGCSAIGIDLDAEHCQIAVGRLGLRLGF